MQRCPPLILQHAMMPKISPSQGEEHQTFSHCAAQNVAHLPIITHHDEMKMSHEASMDTMQACSDLLTNMH